MLRTIIWTFTIALFTLSATTPSPAEPPSTQPSPKSLDDLDRASYKPGPSPWEAPHETVSLSTAPIEHPAGPIVIPLDGRWQLAEAGAEAARLAGDWNDAIPATIPGSVHTALLQAGQIPDPRIGRNDAAARAKSFTTWWFKREFDAPANLVGPTLVFDGVAIHCTVWLNQQRLGEHEGMFGGPSFDVTPLLKAHNTLIVRLNPAPYEKGTNYPNDFFKGMNVGWTTTVVFNNVYGWHYCNIPALGIWRSVRIETAPTVTIDHPFITTLDAPAGDMALALHLRGRAAQWSGTLLGTVEPATFTGDRLHFQYAVASDTATKALHLQFKIPDPHLWWPNDLGRHDLYHLKLSFIPAANGAPDTCQTTFGIRTLRMDPLPGGPRPDKFNWTFVINNRPIFVKGTGWCTMDPLMDFSRPRIDRLVTLAQDQHVQMFRCWGGGMPETDEFYDACDRAGILIMQEWPTAWNSHDRQPYDVLEETVRLNTLRLRNHPALAMWGGGNESDKPFGRAIDMMGRYAVELDGTRPFHRGEAWGGSIHDYACYWGMAPLSHNLTLTADFFGEFGLASVPVLESVLRYLPPPEQNTWPPPDDGTFAYHTPVFNTMKEMERLTFYSHAFTNGRTLPDFITGSQLAQAVGVRHTLERARTRWPQCAGALYYKMNDNYPAASWSCVDWYGAPKIGHYFFQDAFAPLHACVLFDNLNLAGHSATLPVFLLDDSDALKDAAWTVNVRAYDRRLQELQHQTYTGRGSIDRVRRVGDFTLTNAQFNTAPLLVVIDLRRDDQPADRTFYWTNFESTPGCLFTLPVTNVTLHTEAGRVIVKNEGPLPAVAVSISRPGHADTFRITDNYFWLDAGEIRTLSASETDGLQLDHWNKPR